MAQERGKWVICITDGCLAIKLHSPPSLSANPKNQEYCHAAAFSYPSAA